MVKGEESIGYILELQAEACDSLGINPDFLRECERLFGNVIVRGLTQSMKAKCQNEYSKIADIHIATMPLSEFNATIRTMSGRKIILVNWTLISMLLVFNHAFWQCISTFARKDTERADQEFAKMLETARNCILTVRYGAHRAFAPPILNDIPLILNDIPPVMKDMSRILKRFPTSAKEFPPISNEVLWLETITTIAQLSFILCHEFAHASLGHMSTSNTTVCPSFLRSSRNVEVYTHSQIQEFEADKKGFDLFSKIYTEGKDNDKGFDLFSEIFAGEKDMYYGAIHALFLMLHLAEVRVPIDESSPYRTLSHPPALRRWGEISNHWHWGNSRSHKEAGIQMSQQIRLMFEAIEKCPKLWRQFGTSEPSKEVCNCDVNDCPFKSPL